MNKDFAEAVVFTGLCSYLFKAFFLLQWNPADWEQTDRIGMMRILGLVSGVDYERQCPLSGGLLPPVCFFAGRGGCPVKTGYDT